ncbi:MAG: hypothetical protein HY519_02930 [Candidatus Aenigmarchaeota archaeon]|nr:hypothetical protein [Candidatus Aenigmarchaeota archaeon]
MASNSPFWEAYPDYGQVGAGENVIYSNNIGKRTYRMPIPGSEETIVVKPRGVMAAEHGTFSRDQRVVAIFQQLLRYHRVPSADGIVVRPTSRHYEDMVEAYGAKVLNGAADRELAAIRLAIYDPTIAAANAAHGDRSRLDTVRQGLMQRILPKEVFDDFTINYAISQGTTKYRYMQATPSLDIPRFKQWHDRLPGDAREAMHESLEGMSAMLRQGMLFDLYGHLNFGIRDHQMCIIDAEPIQMRDIANLMGATISESDELLQQLFAVAGLEPLPYEDAIRNAYGASKFIKEGQHYDVVSGHRVSSFSTNVQPQEERELYQAILSKSKAANLGTEPFPAGLIGLLDRHAAFTSRFAPDEYGVFRPADQWR